MLRAGAEGFSVRQITTQEHLPTFWVICRWQDFSATGDRSGWGEDIPAWVHRFSRSPLRNLNQWTHP